jgi:hypothetical protein
MKIMVLADAARPVHSIQHENQLYKPDRKGEWPIEDGHVPAARTHGLILKSEAGERAKLADLPGKDEEIALLKARIAELEKKKS